MTSDATIVAGIEIPSVSPVFLTVAGVHVLFGIACVITGFMAMLSEKRRGRHPQFGTIYYWCLSVLFATATFLSVMRWAEDYHLFILGALSFTAGFLGRMARRQGSIRLHITGMGLSYILLLTAFYVDNGHSLPLWRELPPISYWLMPGAVGIPIMIWALMRHPQVRHPAHGGSEATTSCSRRRRRAFLPRTNWPRAKVEDQI